MRRALRIIAALALTAAAAAGGPAARRSTSAAKERRAPARQAAGGPRESLAIIVNKSNPVDDLSFDELRQYFLGERTHWPNGRRVTLVMLRDASRPERDAALRIIYEMREQDFQEHFLRAKFTGELLEAPRFFDTTSRVVNSVFLESDAIGYVRADEVRNSAKVKVVRLDGRMPGDADYKLTF